MENDRLLRILSVVIFLLPVITCPIKERGIELGLCVSITLPVGLMVCWLIRYIWRMQ